MADSTKYTGKCGVYRCGHAESTHDEKEPYKCTHKKCHCLGYQPVEDISAYNTIDGKPAITLYKYQEAYLQDMPKNHILAADTGTGKTFMALAHYDKYSYLKPLLILAPASKVNTGDWERDVKQYFAGRMLPEFEVYSYEKFSRNATQKQYQATGSLGIWEKWAKRFPGGYAVIADEVHKAKNPQSLVGRRLFQVSQKADQFIGLSATPLPNGWIDAINYFKIFRLVKHKTEFKNKYVDEVNYRGFPEIRGYHREGELKRFWNEIARPLTKEVALDLPPITTVPVSLPTPKAYFKILIERMVGNTFLDNPSALLHALRQAVIEPKIKWLDDFLEGVSDNVVIFYNYREEREQILELIKKKYNDRQVFRQDGEKHEIPAKPDWGSLERTITLAQYQSGSTGIELTYAATTIYFSPTYSYSNYEQSIGRTNRNGQTKKMTLYMLCAPGSVERDIWAALKDKKDFQVKQWISNHLTSWDYQRGGGRF